MGCCTVQVGPLPSYNVLKALADNVIKWSFPAYARATSPCVDADASCVLPNRLSISRNPTGTQLVRRHITLDIDTDTIPAFIFASFKCRGLLARLRLIMFASSMSLLQRTSLFLCSCGAGRIPCHSSTSMFSKHGGMTTFLQL